MRLVFSAQSFYSARNDQQRCAPMSDKAIAELVFTPLDNTIQNALYLNAQDSAALHKTLSGACLFQQSFKPEHDRLSAQGLNVQPSLPGSEQLFETVLIHASKNAVETKALIAQGLHHLQPGGLLSICAGNKSGGTRLKKLLQQAGLSDVQDYSKHKARVAWGRKESGIDEAMIRNWFEAGQPQPIANGSYQSWPGIYGWDKIDKGSQLLIDNLPEDIAGKGADFGCGYGYLSCELARRYPAIQSLTCIDAEARALDMCRRNNAGFEGVAFDYLWADLTKPGELKNRDFIIMNPPFHEGQSGDPAIGKAFIANAAGALKQGGTLYMVANSHLPYEQTLEQHFTQTKKLYEGQGFKVFQAAK